MASLSPDIKQSIIRDINNGVPVAEAGKKNRVAYHTAYMIDKQLKKKKTEPVQVKAKSRNELVVILLESCLRLLQYSQ